MGVLIALGTLLGLGDAISVLFLLNPPIFNNEGALQK
jgi:hypothetical protein